MHFVSWYQNYRRKFFALSEELQSLSPSPALASSSELDAIPSPNPVKTEERLEVSHRNFQSIVLATQPNNVSQVPHSPTVSVNTASSHNVTLPFKSQPNSPLLSDTFPSMALINATAPDLPIRAEQPFRHECERVAQTFAKAGGSKEIVVDSQIRDMVLRDLTWTTHPDIVRCLPLLSFFNCSTIRFGSSYLSTNKLTIPSQPYLCHIFSDSQLPTSMARRRSSGSVLV